MRVNTHHHQVAKDLFEAKATTPEVQEVLKDKPHNLTHAQAHDAARTARRQMGIYKALPKGGRRVVSSAEMEKNRAWDRAQGKEGELEDDA